jgi:hypothetical protein
MEQAKGQMKGKWYQSTKFWYTSTG